VFRLRDGLKQLTEVFSLAHFDQLVTSKDPNIHYYPSHFLHNTESLKLNLHTHSQSFHTDVVKNREPLKENESSVSAASLHNHTEEDNKADRLSATVV
jgi:hypothetical protein